MTANQRSNREYVADLAREAGWEVTSDEWTDTYQWPHPVEIGEGGPVVRLRPNSASWDETGTLMLAMDGEPLEGWEIQRFSEPGALAYGFGDTFGDPAGIGRFGVDQVREWVTTGKGLYEVVEQ